MAIPGERHRHLLPYFLVIFPIIVHIVDTILQDCVFGGLISFISLIFLNCDIGNDIDNDVISPCHLQNILDLHIATENPLLDYLNYLRYPQKRLKSFFDNCNLLYVLNFSIPEN